MLALKLPDRKKNFLKGGKDKVFTLIYTNKSKLFYKVTQMNEYCVNSEYNLQMRTGCNMRRGFLMNTAKTGRKRDQRHGTEGKCFT